MHSIRRILVAVRDPEARSVPALNKAAQLARALNARLELFHAIAWPLYAAPYLYSDRGFAGLQTQLEARVIERLRTLARGLGSRGRQHPLRVTVAAEWDMPAYEAVIRRALAIKADLIVAEPHHRQRLLPLLHFNDWELLRRSPVPVLLVRRRGLYARPVVLAAIDPMHRHDRSARLDVAILDLSQILAQALGGPVHAIHAYAPLLPGRRLTDAPDTKTVAALNQKIASAARRRYAWLLRRYPLSSRRRHLVAMPPVEAIERTARETHSAIVTLGVLARSGWQRLLIGRTAEVLLDRLACDVLVVKPWNFRLRIARKPTGPRYLAAPVLHDVTQSFRRAHGSMA
jgi:universal stress protein E